MSVFVRYPDDWIGVPPFGEGEVFQTAPEWADALVAELADVTAMRLTDDETAALAGSLALVGGEVETRGAQSCYVYLESLRGPIHIVDGRMIARGEVGDAPVEEVAGIREPDLVREPTVTEVVTDSGLAGVLCVRHAPFDDDARQVMTLRGSYAFEVDGGFFLLSTATTDLAGFERFRPRFAELAASVSQD
ncbi:hypothetical protein ACX3O0_01520 [Homoserinimonas sp. A447]